MLLLLRWLFSFLLSLFFGRLVFVLTAVCVCLCGMRCCTLHEMRNAFGYCCGTAKLTE